MLYICLLAADASLKKSAPPTPHFFGASYHTALLAAIEPHKRLASTSHVHSLCTSFALLIQLAFRVSTNLPVLQPLAAFTALS